MLLENKVAIVTGGSRGMGRAIATIFAREGCSSVIADLREPEAQDTITAVKKYGKDCIFVKTDVTSKASCEAVVAAAIAKFGKVDILVNSHGVGDAPTFHWNITEQLYDRSVNVNMKGVFLMMQAVSGHMRKNRSGNIITIVSLAGVVPGPGNIHYAAAKAGALAITTNMAFELASYGIRCNSIHPGMVRTDMTSDFSGNPPKEELDKIMTKMTSTTPIAREGTVEEIANAALFFASDMSSYTTGDQIRVGGGSPARALPIMD
jgi:3-oxoacyl-[acyl-carrier protein] reductase